MALDRPSLLLQILLETYFIVSKFLDERKPVDIIFVDLNKAFDKDGLD